MTAQLKHTNPGPTERVKQDNTGVSGRNDRWYVVQTRPNREAEAKRQLENQQFRTFIPLYSKTVSHARKLQKIRAPLFPGYLFVVLDLNRDPWHKVNGTIGVTSLIMAGERPSPVRAGVVETLIESTAKDGALCFVPPLRIGERVRLASGPFSEQLGVLQEFGSSQRVRVLLEIMGGQVPISLPLDAILPVEPDFSAEN
ncbi:transcription termination/antitermination protein NusG [Rhodoblastus sp.]|uniref:transcription termination/antitermination protein NusG n=1 Tax=Rhodoblastus sp. TaxID=1962975 RepID=UPI003F9C2D01